MTKDGEWISGAADIPKSSGNQIKVTMFPPSSEDLAALHLDRWYLH